MLLCLYDVIVESFNIVKKGTGKRTGKEEKVARVS